MKVLSLVGPATRRGRGRAKPPTLGARRLPNFSRCVFLKARRTAAPSSSRHAAPQRSAPRARTRHQQHRLRHTHGLLYNRPKDTNTSHPYRKEYCIFGAGFDFAPAFPTANSSWYGALPPSFIGSVRASPSRTFGTLYSKIAKWRPSVRAAGAGSSSVAKRCVSPAFGTCYPLLHLPHHQHVVRHDHGHVGPSPRHIASTAIDEDTKHRVAVCERSMD